MTSLRRWVQFKRQHIFAWVAPVKPWTITLGHAFATIRNNYTAAGARGSARQGLSVVCLRWQFKLSRGLYGSRDDADMACLFAQRIFLSSGASRLCSWQLSMLSCFLARSEVYPVSQQQHWRMHLVSFCRHS